MLFQVLHIEELPESPLEASAAFFAKHLDDIRELAIDVATDCLAIIVPAAGPDHDDWRRSLVRDLAREFGAHEVINPSNVDPVEAIRELTHGEGVSR